MFRDAAEQIGETFMLHEDKAKDPLFDAIKVLEANCKNARTALHHTRHVLMRLFGGFFPKKKKEMPRVLRKLVEAFDTPRDPTLLLKRSSPKRGAKATIALAMSHGKNVNWAKVSSSLARDEGGKALEMKDFFTEVKK
jgi:hypothetical protein